MGMKAIRQRMEMCPKEDNATSILKHIILYSSVEFSSFLSVHYITFLQQLSIISTSLCWT